MLVSVAAAAAAVLTVGTPFAVSVIAQNSEIAVLAVLQAPEV